MDTLDYSGDGLNTGSKLVLAAYGDVRRKLATSIPESIKTLNANAQLVMPGVIAVNAANAVNAETTSLNSIQEKLRGLCADVEEGWYDDRNDDKLFGRSRPALRSRRYY